jgi:hypothetical protein
LWWQQSEVTTAWLPLGGMIDERAMSNDDDKSSWAALNTAFEGAWLDAVIFLPFDRRAVGDQQVLFGITPFARFWSCLLFLCSHSPFGLWHMPAKRQRRNNGDARIAMVTRTNVSAIRPTVRLLGRRSPGVFPVVL